MELQIKASTFTKLLCILCFCWLIKANENAQTQEEEISPQAKLFSELFKTHRRIQREAIKSINAIGSYEKQYKMMTLVLDKLFTVLSESRITLTEAGFVPSKTDFPEDEKLRDAVSKLMENTAFFGDLVLRFPDMTHRLYDDKNQWQADMKWAWNICNIAQLFTKEDQQLLGLMAQELNFVERDPKYVNPYTEKFKKEQKLHAEATQPKGKQPKKRKKQDRGPKLSRVEL